MRRPTALPAVARRPEYRALWTSAFISDAGDWLLFIALPVVVYSRTGSAFGTSTAFLLELIPGVLLAPFVGWCVDRFERRRLGVVVSGLQAIGLLPLVVPSHGVGVVYAVIVIQAVLGAVAGPVRNALVPQVAADDLTGANSLLSVGENLARLVGGPLGGALLAAGGLPTVVAVDAATFVIAGVTLLRMRSAPSATTQFCPDGLDGPDGPDGPHVANGPNPSPRDASAAVPEPGRSVYRRLLQLPGVVRTLLVLMIAQIAQGLFVVLFVVFVAQRLHGGAGEIGLLRGVQAVGAIGGAVLLVTIGRRHRATVLTVVGAIGCGALELAIWNAPSLTTTPVLYVGLFILVGLPGVLLGVGLLNALQSAAPAGTHGRLFSLFGLASNVGQAAGMLAAGLLTTPLGLTALLQTQAALYLAAGLVAAIAARPRPERARVATSGASGDLGSRHSGQKSPLAAQPGSES